MRALPAITATVITGALSALVLGCGPASTESPTAEPTTATATSVAPQPLASRADELCADYQAAVAANGPLRLDGFNPDQPDPAQLPLIAEHFAPVLAAADHLHERLGALEHGAADERALLAEFIRILGLENQNAMTQSSAAQQANVAGFTATLPNVEPLATARIAAATGLGAPTCALP